jgi:hypothetical protein
LRLSWEWAGHPSGLVGTRGQVHPGAETFTYVRLTDESRFRDRLGAGTQRRGRLKGWSAGMSRESRERLAKALEESRRVEKQIIEADVREDNQLAERIVQGIRRSAPDTDSA